MKTEIEPELDDMPDEIDFSGGVQGKYTGQIEPMKNLVLIESELFDVFESAEAVNDALRILVKAGTEAVKPKEYEQAKAS